MTVQKKVLILVPGQQGGIDRLFEHLNVDASNAGSPIHMRLFVSHGPLLHGIVRFPLRFLSFTFLGLQRRFDLCHMNVSLKGSTLRKMIFGWICRFFGIPYVIHLHGAPYDEFYEKLPRFFAMMVRNYFRRAAKVVVLGTVWQKFAIDMLQVDSDNVAVLPNAVFAPEVCPSRVSDAPARIVFLGLLGERKGVPELLQALASPIMKAQTWSAVIAGDGDVATYEARAHALGIADRIQFPGWVGPDQVKALLTESNILVLPSHAENLPLSMLEGMGYGLCPVVTPVGAVTDVIEDGKNGLLVPVGDVTSLTKALARVCENPDLRNKLAEQARADYLAKYDIRNYRKKLEIIYLEALESPSNFS